MQMFTIPQVKTSPPPPLPPLPTSSPGTGVGPAVSAAVQSSFLYHYPVKSASPGQQQPQTQQEYGVVEEDQGAVGMEQHGESQTCRVKPHCVSNCVHHCVHHCVPHCVSNCVPNCQTSVCNSWGTSSESLPYFVPHFPSFIFTFCISNSTYFCTPSCTSLSFSFCISLSTKREKEYNSFTSQNFV